MNSAELSVAQEGIGRKYQNKLLAFIEVVIVYVSVVGLMWITELIPGFESWQRANIGKAILSAMLYIALPAVLLVYLHGRRVQKVVFEPKAVKKSFKRGGMSLAVMMPATFGFPIAQLFGYNFLDWGGAFIIAALYLIATAVLLWMFKETATIKEIGFSKQDAVIAGGILAGAFLLVTVFHQFNTVVRDIIIAVFFIGFVEEFFFRGYMQSRLNMAFGKPFKMLGLKFGWGLILASAFFGLTHVISPGENPLVWAWGFWTFVAGIGFGVIREKAGSFLAPAVVHGITMIFPILFS